MILNNTTYKMNLEHNIYNKQLANPGMDLGCFTAQVHEYRQ